MDGICVIQIMCQKNLQFSGIQKNPQWRIQNIPDERRPRADPGFSVGEGCQHMILQKFPENWMQLRKF